MEVSLVKGVVFAVAVIVGFIIDGAFTLFIVLPKLPLFTEAQEIIPYLVYPTATFIAGSVFGFAEPRQFLWWPIGIYLGQLSAQALFALTHYTDGGYFGLVAIFLILPASVSLIGSGAGARLKAWWTDRKNLKKKLANVGG